MSAPRKLRAALVQTCATDDRDANLLRIERLLRSCRGADLIVLPEVFAQRGSDELYRRAAEPLRRGALARWLGDLARRHRAWILGGSVLERAGRRIYNTSVLVDRAGRQAATYRKMHLFEAHLENGQVVRERDVYAAGARPVLAATAGWRCGLAICYDIRFPELFRWYAARGAELLLLPSNFTQRTGRDHWEILVRARAIENQCFVLAANQCGPNPATGIRSHGHSLAVGPWGEVLAAAGDEETVLRVDLDHSALARIRRRIPALAHRHGRLTPGPRGA